MPSINERDLAWAWWTCIQEPEDAHAHALRLHLGLIESVEWVRADSPGPLPPPLSQHRKTLEDAWNRFKPRALRNNVNQELAAIHALGGRFISQEDPSFPKELNILQESTPLGLWVRGTLPHTRSVTIVGARATTNLGTRNAFDIASDLADRGDTILSGGAFGIDIAAHRGTLAANGQTIAILAGGVANPYPVSHTRDFETIVESSGAIISEVPPSFRPAKWRFLGRNRMLAAWGGCHHRHRSIIQIRCPRNSQTSNDTRQTRRSSPRTHHLTIFNGMPRAHSQRCHAHQKRIRHPRNDRPPARPTPRHTLR